MLHSFPRVSKSTGGVRRKRKRLSNSISDTSGQLQQERERLVWWWIEAIAYLDSLRHRVGQMVREGERRGSPLEGVFAAACTQDLVNALGDAAGAMACALPQFPKDIPDPMEPLLAAAKRARVGR